MGYTKKQCREMKQRAVDWKLQARKTAKRDSTNNKTREAKEQKAPKESF